MARIEKLWFDNGRIFICTDEKQVLNRPLECFPLLMEATEQERMDFKIGRFGDDVRGNAWMRISIFPVFMRQPSLIMTTK
jgi:hypothetical protein